MNNPYTESELTFHFTRCSAVEKCDEKSCHGLKSVDFMADTEECVCFIEVKNFEQTGAPLENRKRDYKMLTDPDAAFPLEIAMKFKDSLLKKYAEGYVFSKPVVALLIMKLDKINAKQRQRLFDKIAGYVPTGLNNKGYERFSRIKFEIPKMSDTEQYGFTVTQAE
jgi:hypothetical protein